MQRLRIIGGQKLNGTVSISGSKNSALPLLAASILSSDGLTLKNIPDLQDVKTMLSLLESFGISTDFQDSVVKIKSSNISNTKAEYELVSKMRASFLALGPLLAREGEAKVSLPGGCAIGVRPIDLHIKGLEALGATIELKHGYVSAKAHKLIGNTVNFPKITVTGTENILMAATLAKGHTTILNAACEPEIIDLAECLNKMGAQISGQGTSKIEIDGVSNLHNTEHSVISDRIELGTYILTGAITHGKLLLKGLNIDELVQPVLDIYKKIGLQLSLSKNSISVNAEGDLLPIEIETAPFPGFPTDLQAQLMATLCLANGTSKITENIWDNRFMHIAELIRMGANIKLNGSSAIIEPIKNFIGADVMATDLRASFCLIMAGLAAKGETILNRIYHLDRGYETPEKKLTNCGAIIERII